VAVGFQQRQFHLFHADAALLAHGDLEIGAADQLAPQHAVEELAVARDHHRFAFDQPFHAAAAGGDPVHAVVQQDQRAASSRPTGQRSIGAQQRVLHRVAEQHDQQHIERRDLSQRALATEPGHAQHHRVDHLRAQGEFPPRHRQGEQVGHCGFPCWAMAQRGAAAHK